MAIQPVTERDTWSESLRAVASEPLEFRPTFPEIAARHEAWWSQEMTDRPLFLAQVNRNPDRPINRRLELLHDLDAWLEAKVADVAQLEPLGDALPNARVDFGPVFLGGVFGSELEFGADTSWTHPFIDDQWSNAPDWRFDPSNDWWTMYDQRLRRLASEAAGRFLVTLPDFGGSSDVVMNLRGPDNLCLDIAERPELVREHIESIYEAWRAAWSWSYQAVLEQGAGVVNWLTLWSNEPYMIPACDFNYMIGPEMFKSVCLPDIARQAATAKRAVFHLDGPGAARHIDGLLEVPDISAIQFTPGEGTPSALPWIDMFKKIQNTGRSVYVILPASEVEPVLDELSPAGLALVPSGSAEEVTNAYQTLCRRFGVDS